MGYTTEFDGSITIEPPLNKKEIAYLTKFSESRRMDRTKGPYYVDGTGSSDSDIINRNSPPEGQPGLWCNWVPTASGNAIQWNGMEKFYDGGEWMAYLVEHFLCLKPKARSDLPEDFAFLQGHLLNGEILAQGEDPDDTWTLKVIDNTVIASVKCEPFETYDKQVLDIQDYVLFEDPN